MTRESPLLEKRTGQAKQAAKIISASATVARRTLGEAVEEVSWMGCVDALLASRALFDATNDPREAGIRGAA